MKKINTFLCLIFMLSVAFQAYMQVPVKIWDKTIGGSIDDVATCMVGTSDGGFIIAGGSESGISGDKTEASKGGNDYWIVKINSLGQKVWDRTIGGNGNDIPSSIVATNDGGFVIAGNSGSDISGDKSDASRGLSDYWIVKINSLGQKVWDKTIGGDNGDSPRAITVSNDGSFIIVGVSASGISGDKTEPVRGANDYWIVKLNSLGQKVWDKTIGGSSFDDANCVIEISDGSLVIGGSSQSTISGDKTEGSRGFNDYWIVKLNSLGQKVWDKTIGGGSSDFAISIITSPDGGFIVAGVSPSIISGDKTEESKGGADYWIVKLNNSGQKVWDKTIGGGDGEAPYAMIPSNDGGFVVVGQSLSGISGDKSEANKGLDDYWIVKLNGLGQKVWDKSIGGSGADIPRSIIESPNGNFVIAGQSLSGISGDKSDVSKGGRDYWIVKLQTPCPTFPSNIAYVNTNATGANTGVDWANAFTSLESALNAARTCGVMQIWVAQGTYKPSACPTVITGSPTLTNRDFTFELVDGVGIYGGFVGTETALTQRVAGNKTILSGDIGTVGVNTDNCYHVILSLSHMMVCRLDGLTITGGNANGTSTVSGVFQNRGGGLYNEISSPNITNVVFLENLSTSSGGGMYNLNGGPTSFSNVIFSENSARYGGGIYNQDCPSVNLSNVVFSNNTANSGGGGMSNFYSTINVFNTVFSKNITLNSLGEGAGIYNFQSSMTMKNSILSGNTLSGSSTTSRSDITNNNSTNTISYTSMQLTNNTTNYPTANYPNIGTNNNLFAQNPLFVNDTDSDGADNIFMTADDGLALQSASPCKDAGTATGVPTTDITGAARVGNVDMGAYEFQGGVLCTSPTAATAGSNSPVTVGSPINLTSSSTGGTSQTWGGPSGFTSTAQNPSIASATAGMAGVYTVTITSSGTCMATATVDVVVNPAPTSCSPPTGATAGSNSPVTVGSPINLTSSSTGGTSQIWGGPSGFTSTAQNPSIASATAGMAGIYTVTITSSGTCTATATVDVVVNPAPTSCSPPTGATAGSNSPVTVGSLINLTSSSTGGTSQVWGGPSVFTSTAQNPSIASATLGMAGIYTVTVTSSGTCTATATVNVVVNPLPTGAVVFVNVANVSPTQDGNSWATAYSNLQTALTASPANSEIWVAQGTYKPTTTKTQTIYFNIPNRAMLFGGFVGTEVAQSQRNFKNNPTILSGEIGLASTVSDNSYHVVTFDGANNTTLLDGFTITGGNASLVADRVRSNPSSAILPVSINDGGGIALNNGSSPMIINCRIINNDAIVGGGLFATNGSNPTVINCVFMGNQATFGGGVYHLGSSPIYNNVLFAGNKATGGAVYNNGSSPTLTNVTIAGNGGLNGAIFNSSSTPIVKNSIIYGNIMPFNDTQSVVTYSIVEGGYTGIGNLNLNPQLVSISPFGLSPNVSGDYQQTNTSPAIDAGDNGTITLTDKDLIGNLRRFNGGIVDMGAYEFQGSRVGGTVISITSGNWESNSTWDVGRSPLAGDNVTINNNHNVTILNVGTAKNVEIRTNAKIIHSTASSKLQTGI